MIDSPSNSTAIKTLVIETPYATIRMPYSPEAAINISYATEECNGLQILPKITPLPAPSQPAKALTPEEQKRQQKQEKRQRLQARRQELQQEKGKLMQEQKQQKNDENRMQKMEQRRTQRLEVIQTKIESLNNELAQMNAQGKPTEKKKPEPSPPAEETPGQPEENQAPSMMLQPFTTIV